MRRLSAVGLCLLVSVSCSGGSDTGQQIDDADPAVLDRSTNESPTVSEDPVRSADPPVVFERVFEPKERAFSLLIPKGWRTEGGIFRVNPLQQGGAAQSIAAKCDFAAIGPGTEADGSSGEPMMRWLPEMLYFDARHSPAGQMGLFPPGSNYNGMPVWPLLSADAYLTEIIFPDLHPQARDLQVLERKSLPQLARNYLRRVQAFPIQMTFSYDAAMLTLAYTEAGVRYQERLVAVIENWGQLGAGMWGNKETISFRAPLDQFEDWAPIFSVIHRSVQIDPNWLAGELRGQVQRGEIAINTQQEIQRIGREIGEHRQITNAEIHNDLFLTLTEQEEYVNPYTHEVEIGTDHWRHRWQSPTGEVIYTDDESYDPNSDVNLNVTGYEKSRIRPRGPGSDR